MKLLIVDDDQDIVDYIKAVFRIGWPETTLLSTHLGEEGVLMVEEYKPDIVILDLGLPDINGFSVLKRVRLFSNVPIIILSVRGEEKDVVRALELGADEYITKPFRQMELLARVKAMLRRNEPMKENLSISYGPLRFGHTLVDVVFGERSITLTQAEARILYRLMESNGEVVTVSQLAKAIWGNNSADAADSIKVYIHRLRQKIEDNVQNPRLILNKPNIGYFLAPIDQL
jgi:two-component system KDP operon response regulator KdpE